MSPNHTHTVMLPHTHTYKPVNEAAPARRARARAPARARPRPRPTRAPPRRPAPPLPAGGGRTELRERDTALGEPHAVADAAHGEGRVVLVGGEAGIGKTSLVRVFVSRLEDDGGIRVLRGACDNFITPRELGPFHDLARHARPALRKALTGGAPDAVFDELLEELAEPTTVLVVEDLGRRGHDWDALVFLGRRRPLPALLVLTYRDAEVGAERPLRRAWRAGRPSSGG